MGKIILETFIQAPIERCFDLSRSVDLHIKSASPTNEKAILGKTTGLLALHDEVTWEARHFGVIQQLTVRITAYERPKHFRDSQISGIFKRFDHDHFFETKNGGTVMIDSFRFECPFWIFGRLAEPLVYRHLENFLKSRNQEIKAIAESDDWLKYFEMNR